MTPNCPLTCIPAYHWSRHILQGFWSNEVVIVSQFRAHEIKQLVHWYALQLHNLLMLHPTSDGNSCHKCL